MVSLHPRTPRTPAYTRLQPLTALTGAYIPYIPSHTLDSPSQVVGLKHEVQEQQRKIESLRGEQLDLLTLTLTLALTLTLTLTLPTDH